MRRLSINIDPFCFYGLMLGVFWYGLQRKGSTFQVVRGRVLKDENTIYGIGLGTKLYGIGRWLTPIPVVEKLYNGLFTVTKPAYKYTEKQIRETLATIAMRRNPPSVFALQRETDPRSILDLVKFDATRELSADSLKQVEDFIEGHLELPKAVQFQQEVLNTKHMLVSTRHNSESTKRTIRNIPQRLEDWRAQRYPKTDELDRRYETPAGVNVQPEQLAFEGFGLGLASEMQALGKSISS